MGGGNGGIRRFLIYEVCSGDGKAVELGGVCGSIGASRHDMDSLFNVELGKLHFS